jgi:AraC-like DNA-binding protein
VHASDSQGRQVSLADINALTAAAFGLTGHAFRSNRRDGLLVRARWTAMWLAQHLTNSTASETGRALGQRDHTTILHGRRRAGVLIGRRDAFATIAHALRNALQGDTTTMTDEETAYTLRRITAALRDKRLTSLERLVLAELRGRARRETHLTITMEDIARALDVSERSVLTAMREMEALRILDAILPHNGHDTEREIIVQLRLGTEGV